MEQTMNKTASPMVSVVVTTYQHRAYIEECIQGILMQETSFPVEILIGEDESTDGTREICQRMAAAYPGRIQLFLRSRKDVIYMGGRATGRANLIATLQAARGRYIAFCDGDDHWTDPLKLQKQVDCLEADPEAVLCFHKVLMDVHGKLVKDGITEPRFEQVAGHTATVLDLLRIGNFIHFPSVVFRNVLTHFPDEFRRSPLGDYFLFIMLMQHGNAFRLEDTMAVYRSGVGIFSSLPSVVRAREILATDACLLSYLSDREQRIILLDQYMERLQRFDQLIKAHVIRPGNLAPYVPIRLLLRMLVVKLRNQLRGGSRDHKQAP